MKNRIGCTMEGRRCIVDEVQWPHKLDIKLYNEFKTKINKTKERGPQIPA